MSIADKTTAHVVAVNACMRALGDLEGLTYEQTRAALVRALYKPGDLDGSTVWALNDPCVAALVETARAVCLAWDSPRSRDLLRESLRPFDGPGARPPRRPRRR